MCCLDILCHMCTKCCTYKRVDQKEDVDIVVVDQKDKSEDQQRQSKESGQNKTSSSTTPNQHSMTRIIPTEPSKEENMVPIEPKKHTAATYKKQLKEIKKKYGPRSAEYKAALAEIGKKRKGNLQ